MNSEEQDMENPLEVYPGDMGTLPLEVRRVLIHLLSGPSIDARKHSILWQILLNNEITLRQRMGDLCLEVVLDRDNQIAFTRQVSVEGKDIPRLLRRVKLSYLDSVLLLHLRKILTEASGRDERATVEVSELMEYLQVFRKTLSTDLAGFTRRCTAAVEKMKENSLLLGIRGVQNRYEVSPALGILFPPEEISALTRAYEEIAAKGEGVSEYEEEALDE